MISEQANVRSDCSGFEELPLVGVEIDGYILNLRPQDYVFRSADGGSCRSAFYPMNIPPPKGPIVMLGVPFLTAFYSIYDRESLKIGLALAAHKGAVGVVPVGTRVDARGRAQGYACHL